MTPTEFRTALDALGIGLAPLARLTGRTPDAARRWADGSAAVPAPLAEWLRRHAANPPPVLDGYRPVPPRAAP
jgi:hypothetical protein